MIRRWFIIGFLCLVILALLKDLYEAIMYNPMEGIKNNSVETANHAKLLLPVSEIGWSKAIIDNNLFSPTRGYAPPPPPPKTSVQIKPIEIPKRPEIHLKGIVLDQSGDYIAYIEKDLAKPVPVRRGDWLDDVEVIDVKQRSIELKWNEEMISLSLDKIKTIKKSR